jgi:hypothetical protein
MEIDLRKPYYAPVALLNVRAIRALDAYEPLTLFPSRRRAEPRPSIRPQAVACCSGERSAFALFDSLLCLLIMHRLDARSRTALAAVDRYCYHMVRYYWRACATRVFIPDSRLAADALCRLPAGLQSLHMHGAHCSYALSSAVGTLAHSLQRLTLTQCRLDAQLVFALQRLLVLRVVELEHCSADASALDVLQFAEHALPAVQSLVVKGMCNDTAVSVLATAVCGARFLDSVQLQASDWRTACVWLGALECRTALYGGANRLRALSLCVDSACVPLSTQCAGQCTAYALTGNLGDSLERLSLHFGANVACQCVGAYTSALLAHVRDYGGTVYAPGSTPTLRELELRGACLLDDYELAALVHQHAATLRRIALPGQSRLDVCSAHALARLASLEALDVSDTRFLCAEHVAHWRQLTELVLQRSSSVDSALVAALPNSLRRLDVSASPGADSSFAGALAYRALELRALAELDVSDCAHLSIAECHSLFECYRGAVTIRCRIRHPTLGLACPVVYMRRTLPPAGR